jgi:hypothetical protein
MELGAGQVGEIGELRKAKASFDRAKE